MNTDAPVATFDKEQLVEAMAVAHELFDRLPYWDNTAKLHGKVAMLKPTAEAWDERGDLRGLLHEVQFLEKAVRRLQERDPHTRLLRHLTEWRERLETATAAPSSPAAGGAAA